MVALTKILEWFKAGLEPTEEQFKQSWTSFWHKSERLPQTQILGLNDSLNDKASKDDLASVVSGLIPMGSVENMVELEAKIKRNNDSYYVNDQLDDNNNPYIFRYDAELDQWVNTKQVVYKDVVQKADLELKADKDDLVQLEADVADVFVQFSTDYSIWKKRIIAATINVNDVNLFYSPAAYSKTNNLLSIRIYATTTPSGEDYQLIDTLNYVGDTSINETFEIDGRFSKLFINPSLFDLGEFRNINYSKAGFTINVLNSKNATLISYESSDISNVFISLDWIQGKYIDREGIPNINKDFQYTDLTILPASIKALILSGNKTGTSALNNISFYDSEFQYISGWYSTETETKNISINIPVNAFYYALSNNITDGEITTGYLRGDIVKDAARVDKKRIDYFDYMKDIALKTGYINTSGASMNNNDWRYNDFLRILPGKTYLFSGIITGGSATVNYISFYESKNESSYVSGYAFIPGNTLTFYRERINVPDNCNYIRMSGLADNIANYELCGKTEDFLITLRDFEEEIEYVDNTFVLPAYIDCVVGLNNDLFIDAFLNEPDRLTGQVLIKGNDTSSPIRRRGNSLRYVPSDTSVDTVLKFSKTDNSLNELFSKSTIFRPIKKNGNGEEVNICQCGDSLINAGYAVTEMFRLLSEDNDFIFNQIGTVNQGGSLHEGRGHWSWSDYVNPAYETTPYAGRLNAFMYNGKLDFQHYMDANFPGKQIGIFIMSLGTNDVTQGVSIPSDNKFNQIIADAKKFINALLSSEKGFPNCKVVIGMPASGAPIFATTETSAEIFRKSILTLNQKYIEEFDNGKYHANVTCVPHGAYIDRINSYPYFDEPINDYVSETVRRYTDGIHTTEVGYKQLGRGYYNKVRALLDGYL